MRVLESKRSLSTTTTRNRTFGGDWRLSSTVRHRGLVDWLPSHAIDLVLCARVAGPFSRLPSSQLVIKRDIVASGSPSTRQYAARGRAQSL